MDSRPLGQSEIDDRDEGVVEVYKDREGFPGDSRSLLVQVQIFTEI